MTSRPRALLVSATVAALTLVGAGLALAATGVTVGPRSDGTAIAPTGHRITPFGRQTALGDLPLGSALSPDGSTLLVTNDGQGTESLQVVDVASGKLVQTVPYSSPASLFLGVVFSPDGRTVFASGGGDGTVHRYAFADQHLVEGSPITVGKKLFPAGLAVTGDGSRLVVADHLGDAVSVVDLAGGQVSTTAVGPAPRSVTVSKDGRTAWVTQQGGNDVTVLDLSGSAPRVRTTVPVGTHPVAAVLDRPGKRLYVADAESDEVSVLDAATDRVVSTWSLAPYDGAQVGVHPSDLVLTPNGKTLYVTGAGNDDVAVVDTATGKVSGAVPTGWYPTSVELAGNELLVTNGKGLGAGPNDGPGHPDPTAATPTSPNQYVGSMMVGTLSAVRVPLSPSRLSAATAQVRSNNEYAAAQSSRVTSTGIKHVIYVVQENRTFDQVFGDLGKGNGDPSLTLFGDDSALNQRALQRQYVTFDNFYADADISAQGWNWTTAGDSPLYSEELWPSNYSGRGAPYPSENGNPAIAPNRVPSDAYLWDRMADKGISFRNYGFYVNTTSGNVNTATDPVLDRSTDHAYRGFDLGCPDNADTFAPLKADCGTPRYDEWKSEFDKYVAADNLPTVELLRLPNDHTAGTKPGSPTPKAYVADNDLALGRVVDSVTHSKYGKDTAIVVTEDDAQNGPDHVDAHRTLAQVISPWTRTGSVDSTLYSTASMLRTIELLVGLDPLTQFDAESAPMTTAFSDSPDDAAFSAQRPAQAGNTLNTPGAPMAAVSARQSLTREDQIDERSFNEAIWQSVKGRDVPMPAPHGAAADD